MLQPINPGPQRVGIKGARFRQLPKLVESLVILSGEELTQGDASHPFLFFLSATISIQTAFATRSPRHVYLFFIYLLTSLNRKETFVSARHLTNIRNVSSIFTPTAPLSDGDKKKKNSLYNVNRVVNELRKPFSPRRAAEKETSKINIDATMQQTL